MAPIQALFNCILEKGCVPTAMCEVYSAPLGEPGKNPGQCTSKGPISLICAVAKVLEAMVYRILLPQFQPVLSSR